MYWRSSTRPREAAGSGWLTTTAGGGSLNSHQQPSHHPPRIPTPTPLRSPNNPKRPPETMVTTMFFSCSFDQLPTLELLLFSCISTTLLNSRHHLSHKSKQQGRGTAVSEQRESDEEWTSFIFRRCCSRRKYGVSTALR